LIFDLNFFSLIYSNQKSKKMGQIRAKHHVLPNRPIVARALRALCGAARAQPLPSK
jgi:hypothetical protein